MSAAVKYERGPLMLVRIEGHTEPTYMTSILRRGFVAGGGLMLVLDHGNGEIDQVLKLLNDLVEMAQAKPPQADHHEQDLAMVAQPERVPLGSMTPEQVRDGIADWIETHIGHKDFWTPEVVDLIRSIEINGNQAAHNIKKD